MNNGGFRLKSEEAWNSCLHIGESASIAIVNPIIVGLVQLHDMIIDIDGILQTHFSKRYVNQ